MAAGLRCSVITQSHTGQLVACATLVLYAIPLLPARHEPCRQQETQNVYYPSTVFRTVGCMRRACAVCISDLCLPSMTLWPPERHAMLIRQAMLPVRTRLHFPAQAAALSWSAFPGLLFYRCRSEWKHWAALIGYAHSLAHLFTCSWGQLKLPDLKDDDVNDWKAAATRTRSSPAVEWLARKEQLEEETCHKSWSMMMMVTMICAGDDGDDDDNLCAAGTHTLPSQAKRGPGKRSERGSSLRKVEERRAKAGAAEG
eukprot:scaffold53616_cov23-Tisochrysis_lutea.AAC.1